MKAPRMIWLMLLAAAALCYLQPVPQPAARIRIESDADASNPTTAPRSSAPYDPYFIHVNDFGQVSIPAVKPK